MQQVRIEAATLCHKPPPVQVFHAGYEVASIEGSSVYVKGLNTYFYANDANEVDVVFNTDTIFVDNVIQLQGTIVDTSRREFTLDTGIRKMRISTNANITQAVLIRHTGEQNV